MLYHFSWLSSCLLYHSSLSSLSSSSSSLSSSRMEDDDEQHHHHHHFINKNVKQHHLEKAAQPSVLEQDGREAKMWWRYKPRSALVVKKYNDAIVTDGAMMVSSWLTNRGLNVYVDSWRNALDMEDRYEVVNPRDPKCRIDLVVCLGGDGTILHANTILNQYSAAQQIEQLPPVVSFGMGSLGFLTPFSVQDWKPTLEEIFASTSKRDAINCSLRSRLTCKIDSGDVRSVLNDVVIGRGVSPSLCKLSCTVDQQPVALFQSDGLIISTPSGSTAYSLSAGGTMVAPSISCTLLTPIAPHSLSSRPVAIHGESCIEVTVPTTARSPAFVSFDGRDPMYELPVGETLTIEPSPLSLPLLTYHGFDHEWFQSLTTKLGWNTRVEQKPLHSSSNSRKRHSKNGGGGKNKRGASHKKIISSERSSYRRAGSVSDTTSRSSWKRTG